MTTSHLHSTTCPRRGTGHSQRLGDRSIYQQKYFDPIYDENKCNDSYNYRGCTTINMHVHLMQGSLLRIKMAPMCQAISSARCRNEISQRASTISTSTISTKTIESFIQKFQGHLSDPNRPICTAKQ